MLKLVWIRLKSMLSRFLRRVVPSNKLFVNQIGYLFYQKRSTLAALHKIRGGTYFLPSYLDKKTNPLYKIHDWDPNGLEAFITDGYSDWGLERILLLALNEGGCLIDVGAHSGYFSHLLYGKCSHFINVETSKKCYDKCLVPLQAQWKDKVVCNINAPAYDREGMEILIEQTGDGWGMSSELGQYSHGNPIDVVSMRSVSIDAMYSRLESTDQFHNIPVTAIKIDVDGCDTEVLHGGLNILNRFRPIIYMESLERRAFTMLCQSKYSVYTLIADKSNPRMMSFRKAMEPDFLESNWYKMCIAAPIENNLLDFFVGMTRDNHDKKHVFVDI